jgi:hypothetical protein
MHCSTMPGPPLVTRNLPQVAKTDRVPMRLGLTGLVIIIERVVLPAGFPKQVRRHSQLVRTFSGSGFTVRMMPIPEREVRTRR